MTPAASSTAVIMIGMCGDIPTAVMTESSEKTMSMSMICTTTVASARSAADRDAPLAAFELVVDLVGALAR